jgi:nondiscriminating glutamyl-tRNA synthetase
MYTAFGYEAPIFWHLPILCNVDGKKLSKRDFGFSLKDLKESGFLPEAIDNYLAILGASFEKEIMSLDEIVNAINFESIKTTGNIKYDVDKLRWMNHKWIQNLDPHKLAELLHPILLKHYPIIKEFDNDRLIHLTQGIKSELTVLPDAIPALNFYFEAPILTKNVILEHIPEDQVAAITALIQKNIKDIGNVDRFVEGLKAGAKEQSIKLKLLFTTLRLLLTGSDKGPSINELITLLGSDESKKRIEKLI